MYLYYAYDIIFGAAVVLALFSTHCSSGDAFGFILNITGGIVGSIPSFILPAAMYLKVCKNSEWLYYPAAVVLVVGVKLGDFALIFLCKLFQLYAHHGCS